jgi:hypothetical protein
MLAIQELVVNAMHYNKMQFCSEKFVNRRQSFRRIEITVGRMSLRRRRLVKVAKCGLLSLFFRPLNLYVEELKIHKRRTQHDGSEVHYVTKFCDKY